MVHSNHPGIGQHQARLGLNSCMTAAVQEQTLTLATTPGSAPPPAVRAHPDIVLGLILAGAIGCVALWWQNTLTLNGVGDWLINAGRIPTCQAGVRHPGATGFDLVGRNRSHDRDQQQDSSRA